MNQTFRDCVYEYCYPDITIKCTAEENTILHNIGINGVLLGDILLTKMKDRDMDTGITVYRVQIYHYTLILSKVTNIKGIPLFNYMSFICRDNDLDELVPYDRFMYMAKNQCFHPVNIKSARNV